MEFKGEKKNPTKLLHYVLVKEGFPPLLWAFCSSWVLCCLRKWSMNRPVRRNYIQRSLQSVLFFIFAMRLVISSAPIEQGCPASVCCVIL